MALTVAVTQKAKGVYVVSPAGMLNSETAPLFETRVDEILDLEATLILFDLAELEYLSSAGLRVIFKAQQGVKKNNGKVTFMNLKPQIKKVFDIINALPKMQIFSSIQELDAYLDVMQKGVGKGE